MDGISAEAPIYDRAGLITARGWEWHPTLIAEKPVSSSKLALEGGVWGGFVLTLPIDLLGAPAQHQHLLSCSASPDSAQLFRATPSPCVLVLSRVCR